jgi:hypothetical protein
MNDPESTISMLNIPHLVISVVPFQKPVLPKQTLKLGFSLYAYFFETWFMQTPYKMLRNGAVKFTACWVFQNKKINK